VVIDNSISLATSGALSFSSPSFCDDAHLLFAGSGMRRGARDSPFIVFRDRGFFSRLVARQTVAFFFIDRASPSLLELFLFFLVQLSSCNGGVLDVRSFHAIITELLLVPIP